MSEYSLQLLDDQTVFRRTPAGQRELSGGGPSFLKPLERRFLSAVTGHTPLRVLLDLGLGQPGIADAIITLAGQGLIKVEHIE